MATYAEVFGIVPPALPVRAPCCGQRRAADMVAELPALPAAARAALRHRFGWAALPRFACDGCRATMHREGLARGLGIPGTH